MRPPLMLQSAIKSNSSHVTQPNRPMSSLVPTQRITWDTRRLHLRTKFKFKFLILSDLLKTALRNNCSNSMIFPRRKQTADARPLKKQKEVSLKLKLTSKGQIKR